MSIYQLIIVLGCMKWYIYLPDLRIAVAAKSKVVNPFALVEHVIFAPKSVRIIKFSNFFLIVSGGNMFL